MHAPCKSIVVKLGGSLITEKDKPYTIAWDRLSRAARIIGTYYRRYAEEGLRLVVVHGGGSYGHYAVHEARQKVVIDQLDVARIQLVMNELAIKVARSLIEEKVPVTIIPGHALCPKRKGRCNLSLLIENVVRGMVPLTYGDGIYNEGVVIISGDDLAILAASAINADCLVFVSNVPGVLDEDGVVIPHVSSPNQVPDLTGTSNRVDLTGGMKAKVEKALSFSRDYEDTRIFIVDLEGLEKLLRGERAGTLLSSPSD